MKDLTRVILLLQASLGQLLWVRNYRPIVTIVCPEQILPFLIKMPIFVTIRFQFHYSVLLLCVVVRGKSLPDIKRNHGSRIIRQRSEWNGIAFCKRRWRWIFESLDSQFYREHER